MPPIAAAASRRRPVEQANGRPSVQSDSGSYKNRRPARRAKRPCLARFFYARILLLQFGRSFCMMAAATVRQQRLRPLGQEKRPLSKGTRTKPIKATPPPLMSCFIPCDFAPGLSFPYPSKRLMTPQIPRPAPRAMTNVCNTPTAESKNAIPNFPENGNL